MVGFTWNGRRLQGRASDSAALALHRNGIRALAATRKRHRPLGWSGSFTQGVLAEADGVLAQIIKNEGDTVLSNELLGTLNEGGAVAAAPAVAAQAAAPEGRAQDSVL